MKRILVIGHAQHGKGTVCKILQEQYGYKAISSSAAAFDEAIWPIMQHYYATKEECVADKDNWRPLWRELIGRYNKPDLTRLANKIWSQADIYDGLRSQDEYDAIYAAKMFDVCLWVDAANRMPLEPKSSMELSFSRGQFLIDNNGPEEDLQEEIKLCVDYYNLLPQ